MVKSGTTLKASYTYLADGTKLRVADASGNGFYYLGSLTYVKNSAGIQLEGASTASGRVLVAAGSRVGTDIRYFLTDHLGSVRSIVDQSGTVKERNDYYPFGTRYSQSGGNMDPANRLKYNGKEDQTTGNLGYLDYGARMYDTELGRWFCVDPMAEAYYSSSSYNYCANNCIKNIDPDGALYSPYYDSQGNFLGVDKGGFSGQIYITTLKSYLNVILNDQWDSKMKRMQDVNLSAKAYSKIYSHVLSKAGYDMSRLENKAVSVKTNEDSYNTPSSNVRLASTIAYRGKKTFKISVNQENEFVKKQFNFVENIVNTLGVHEYTGHGIKHYSDKTKTHQKAYDLQMIHPSWEKTTYEFKQGMLINYSGYLKDLHLDWTFYRQIYNRMENKQK